MISVSKSVGATVTNGALSFWYQNADGLLADVFAVSIQILDGTGGTVLAKTALNMANAPTGTHVGTGHYAYAWTPGAGLAVGLYVVRWFYRVASTDTEASFDLPLELVAVPYPLGPHYCTVQSLRDEGLASTGVGGSTDAQAQAAIVRASRYVEHFTGRGGTPAGGAFEPVRKTIRANGSGARAVLFDEPIVAIEEFLIADPLGSPILIDDAVRVYNRHIREGLLNPDDRDSPKMEFIHGDDLPGVPNSGETERPFFLMDLVWPRGRQNVHVTGVFGYTEPDGSFVGGTPAMIQEVTRLLVFRNLDKLIKRSGAPTTAIIQETTKDQTVIRAQPGAGGDNRSRAFTGDPEIDMLLLAFIRPPKFGAA